MGLAAGGAGGAVVVVSDGASDDDLVQALQACDVAVHLASPDDAFARITEAVARAVVVEPSTTQSTIVADLSARLPSATRVIAIGNLRSMAQEPGAALPDCVVFADPDEATLRGVLEEAPPIDPQLVLDELLPLSVLGVDLPATLRELTTRVARAFGADDCVLVLAQETVCYTARELADEAVADLVPLCETVCQFA